MKEEAAVTDTEKALDYVFNQIENGTIEQATQVFNESYKMLGTLTQDLLEGNISKVASDTAVNLATPLRMLATGAFDLFTGNWGKFASDTAANISNLASLSPNAATKLYDTVSAAQTLRKAGVSGMFRSGLLDRIANVSPDKLNPVIDEMLKNPLFAEIKTSLGAKDEKLREYLKSSLTLLKEMSPGSRKKLGENIANFIDSKPNPAYARDELIGSIFDIAKESPEITKEFVEFSQNAIEQILEHKQTGQNPPKYLDVIAKNIAPYKELISNLNNTKALTALVKDLEFKNLVKNIVVFATGDAIEPGMTKDKKEKITAENDIKAKELFGSVGKILKPDVLVNVLPAITGEALAKLPALQRGPSYAESKDAYKEIPGILKENKERLIKEGILTKKEYKALLKSCEGLEVNKELEDQVHKANDLSERITMIKEATNSNVLRNIKPLAPGLKDLAKDEKGLESVRNELLSNKERTIGALNAIIESPSGGTLKLCGLTGERLYKRLHVLITPKGIESLAKLIEEPSAVNALRLLKETKSIAFTSSCIKNAAINISKKAPRKIFHKIKKTIISIGTFTANRQSKNTGRSN